MTYSNKFVLCVLVNGQPQNEKANGTVSLPFGAEYALRLRNKNDRRAVAKIYIDGENVSGGGYVINANDHVDIKRHHDKDRAFKFVALESPEAVDFGKNGPNPDKTKGLVEVHFFLEKEVKYTYRPPEVHHHHHHHYRERIIREPQPWIPPYNPHPYPYRPDVWCSNNTGGACVQPTYGMSADMGSVECSARGMSAGTSSKSANLEQLKLDVLASNPQCLGVPLNLPLQDGCTVEGHSTGQSFHTTYVDYEETATVLKIYLQGYEVPEQIASVQPPPLKRRTNKEQLIDDLESQNEELRRKIAELENEKLKKKLEELEH